MGSRTQIRFFLPFVVLLVAAAVYFSLVNSKNEREKPALTEKVWQVQTISAELREMSPEITLYGRIESPEQLQAAAPGGGIVDQCQQQMLESGILMPTLRRVCERIVQRSFVFVLGVSEACDDADLLGHGTGC